MNVNERPENAVVSDGFAEYLVKSAEVFKRSVEKVKTGALVMVIGGDLVRVATGGRVPRAADMLRDWAEYARQNHNEGGTPPRRTVAFNELDSALKDLSMQWYAETRSLSSKSGTALPGSLFREFRTFLKERDVWSGNWRDYGEGMRRYEHIVNFACDFAESVGRSAQILNFSYDNGYEMALIERTVAYQPTRVPFVNHDDTGFAACSPCGRMDVFSSAKYHKARFHGYWKVQDDRFDLFDEWKRFAGTGKGREYDRLNPLVGGASLYVCVGIDEYTERFLALGERSRKPIVSLASEPSSFTEISRALSQAPNPRHFQIIDLENFADEPAGEFERRALQTAQNGLLHRLVPVFISLSEYAELFATITASSS